jgi:hypothetical protein
VFTQKAGDTDKLHALHAPEVECIAKGKARTRYELGVKTSIAVTGGATIWIGNLLPQDQMLPSGLSLPHEKCSHGIGQDGEARRTSNALAPRRRPDPAEKASQRQRPFGAHAERAIS